MARVLITKFVDQPALDMRNDKIPASVARFSGKSSFSWRDHFFDREVAIKFAWVKVCIKVEQIGPGSPAFRQNDFVTIGKNVP